MLSERMKARSGLRAMMLYAARRSFICGRNNSNSSEAILLFNFWTRSKEGSCPALRP